MIKPFDRLGFDTPDFLSVILPAQASKAKVAGLADTTATCRMPLSTRPNWASGTAAARSGR
jgi:hypothetical protein